MTKINTLVRYLSKPTIYTFNYYIHQHDELSKLVIKS